jgi:predicted transcriptional regulator
MQEMTEYRLTTVSTGLPSQSANELQAIADARRMMRPTLIRQILLEWLTAERQAEAMRQAWAAFLATLPIPAAEEVQALLRAQGAKPVTRFEDLLGQNVEDSDEFDVDEFLQERRRWQWEGAIDARAEAEAALHPAIDGLQMAAQDEEEL